MMLPDTDGLEILRRLQDNRPPELCCVIVLTRDATSNRAPAAKALGADMVLTKPVDIADLVDAIQQFDAS